MCLIQRESLCTNQNPSEAQNCIVFTISKLNLKSSVIFLQVNFDLPLITSEKCFPEDKIVTSTFFFQKIIVITPKGNTKCHIITDNFDV